jgi:hypothetical protein
MKKILVVLSNPYDGRDEEFNEWYSYVHIRDVMRSRSAIAVQRFKLADDQLPGAGAIEHRYLAIYEGDDYAGLTEGHSEVFTPVMPISDSFRFEDFREAYYDGVIARSKVAEPDGIGDVIVERIAANAGGEAFVEWYAGDRFARVMQLPGIKFGRFGKVAGPQMVTPHFDAQYLAIYRTTDRRRSLEAWARMDREAPVEWQPYEAITACYSPLIPRLTAYEALHPNPVDRERAAKAREALGERVYRGAPEILKIRQ